MELTSLYHYTEKATNRLDAIKEVSPPNEAINVVFASDQNFLIYTCVTLASLLTNYRGAMKIRVFLLLDRKLSEQDQEKYQDLQKIHSFELIQIVIDEELYSDLRTAPGITIATYFRLRIHEVLPSDVSKAIYLDGDTIVRSSIDELFNIDLGSYAVAGVEDEHSQVNIGKFSQHPQTLHINTGVLLLDLNKLRMIDFAEIVNDYLESRRYAILLVDQQIITSIFGLRTLRLPVKWNVHENMFENGWVESFAGITNSADREEYKNAIRDPAIIHYTFDRKPWLSRKHPWSGEWFHYLEKTKYSLDTEQKSGHRE